MCQFVESIKFLDGVYHNLEYHQVRFDNTRAIYFPEEKYISLEKTLNPPAALTAGTLYKCRIIYNENITGITYEPYTPKIIKQYHLVVCPQEFDYSHKSIDRTFFMNAQKNIRDDEDFIYIQKGRVTDSSFANLVFFDGKEYYTPANPLLKGTKRNYYLHQGIIREEEIRVKDIQHFQSFCIVNAMVDLDKATPFSCNKLLLSHIHLKL